MKHTKIFEKGLKERKNLNPKNQVLHKSSPVSTKELDNYNLAKMFNSICSIHYNTSYRKYSLSYKPCFKRRKEMIRKLLSY